jgi:hypothetical protein
MNSQFVLINGYNSALLLISGSIASLIFKSFDIFIITSLIGLMFFKIIIFHKDKMQLYWVFGFFTFLKKDIKLIKIRLKPFVTEGGVMLFISTGNILFRQEIIIYRKKRLFNIYKFLLENGFVVKIDMDEGDIKRKLLEIKRIIST